MEGTSITIGRVNVECELISGTYYVQTWVRLGLNEYSPDLNADELFPYDSYIQLKENFVDYANSPVYLKAECKFFIF